MARVVNVLNGIDDVPGATITRYCSSSVQTTRMAFHAIKAGEGDVFISAGVETVSRFAKGTSDHWPDTNNPPFDDAKARTDEDRRGRPGLARPARGRPAPRRLHRDGPDRRERRQAARPEPPGARRVRRPVAEPRREGDRQRLLGARDHPGHHPRRPSSAPTTARAPASPTTASRTSSRSSVPTASSPPATAAPSTTAPPRSSSCPTPRRPSSA